ncbi:MAG: bifunctional metallophosphatase/5'-nucleotidase, partial [Bacteroidetes bacterium]|nr:bifunctional metallophosphatase/5'-nucleotidase [Bacteroidota bacterium]
VFGLGVELDGLVDKKMYGETIFIDPIEKAAETAHLLKKDLGCDLVICLSHLGYTSKVDNKACDVVIAKQSKNIDLIIGGHSHTFIDKPYKYLNSDYKDIYVCQVGWAGVKLGRIDFYFEKKSKKIFVDAYTINIFNNQV